MTQTDSASLLLADSPVNTYAAHSIGHGVKQVARLAFPNMASFVVSYITTVTTALSISALNDSEMLASVGLGNLVGNLLGFSIGVGLMSVLDTLIAQAAGARNLRLATRHLARGRIVGLLISVPCIVAMLSSDELLRLAGQDPATCYYSHLFVSWSSIGIVPFFMFTADASFLRAYHINNPTLVVNALSAVIQGVVCIILVNYLGLGLMGAGLSLSISNWSKWIFLQLYLWKSSANKEVSDALSFHNFFDLLWQELTIGSEAGESVMVGIAKFVGIAIPSAGLIWSEWWSYELQAIIAGWLGTEALAAHVVCCNVETIMYMFPLGVQQASSVLVGNSLGAGKPRKATQYAKICTCLGALLVLTIASLVFSFRESIASIYTRDPLVVTKLHSALGIVAAFHTLNGLSCVLEGVLRGMRLQEKAVNAKVAVMVVFQLPLCYIMSRGLGLNGLWYASCIAFVVSNSFYVSVILRADFTECAFVAMKESAENFLLA